MVRAFDQLVSGPRLDSQPFVYAVFRVCVCGGEQHTISKMSCYIVRRHQIQPLKCTIFINKHNIRDWHKMSNYSIFLPFLRLNMDL